jgi:hypothetical protein
VRSSERPFFGEVLHQTEWADHSLAEKPKVDELQMDWLRSEDLKEEKNVTAPVIIIAVRGGVLGSVSDN